MSHRSEREPEAALRTYIAGVVLLSGAATYWAWSSLPEVLEQVGQPLYGFPIGFVLATAAVELLPSRTRDGLAVTLGNVVLLTALLVGGPALAICATLGVIAGCDLTNDRRVQRTLFNYGQTTLSVAAAGSTFLLLGGVVGSVRAAGTLAAFLAAAVVYTLTNFVLVAFVIRLASGERVRSTFGSVLRSTLVLQMLYAGFAVLAATLLVGVGWIALALLIVPFIVARQGLHAFQREAEAYDDLVGALLKAIEVKDGYTAGHTDRVSTLCVEVARDLGFGYAELRSVQYAAKLHDVGKLAVPSSVINKPGALDEHERELIRVHPTLGAEILGEIDFLCPALDGVRYHHERIDGEGYPYGIKGDQLPMLARIITVCDAFDAMTTTRSYRQAMEIADAFAELRRCGGTQFDSEVIETLAGVVQRLEWQPTRDAYRTPVSSSDPVTGRV